MRQEPDGQGGQRCDERDQQRPPRMDRDHRSQRYEHLGGPDGRRLDDKTETPPQARCRGGRICAEADLKVLQAEMAAFEDPLGGLRGACAERGPVTVQRVRHGVGA